MKLQKNKNSFEGEMEIFVKKRPSQRKGGDPLGDTGKVVTGGPKECCYPGCLFTPNTLTVAHSTAMCTLV